MSIERWHTDFGRWSLVLVLGAIGAGCGPATLTVGGTGATAGKDGTAGLTGTAGASGGAGTGSGSGGTLSYGGSFGSGGAGGVCSAALCIRLDCDPGSHPVIEPGQCCATSCAPDGTQDAGVGCDAVQCAPTNCAADQKPVIPAGQCCAICVPADDTCAMQQAAYEQLYSSLVSQPDLFACQNDEECGYLIDPTPCSPSFVCSMPVMTVSAVNTIRSALTAFDQTSCSACRLGDTGTCPPVAPVARCVSGKCTDCRLGNCQ